MAIERLAIDRLKSNPTPSAAPSVAIIPLPVTDDGSSRSCRASPSDARFTACMRLHSSCMQE